MGIKKYFVNVMLKKWEERDNQILSKQSLPVGIEEKINIPYIEDGHRGHMLDVYYPKEAKTNFLSLLIYTAVDFFMDIRK